MVLVFILEALMLFALLKFSWKMFDFGVKHSKRLWIRLCDLTLEHETKPQDKHEPRRRMSRKKVTCVDPVASTIPNYSSESTKASHISPSVSSAPHASLSSESHSASAPVPSPIHSPIIPARKGAPSTPTVIGGMGPRGLTRSPALRVSSNPYRARHQEGGDKRSVSASTLSPESTSSGLLTPSDRKIAKDQEVHYPDLTPALPRERTARLPQAATPVLGQTSSEGLPLSTAQQVANDRYLALLLQSLDDPESDDVTLERLLQMADDYENALQTSRRENVRRTAPGRLGSRENPIELTSDAESSDVEMWYDTTDVVRECELCGEAYPVADFPSLSSCIHEAEFCAACYARWIKSELDAKGWRAIKCPATACKTILAYHEVQQYATPDVFADYDRFSVVDTLGQVPNFKWCRNPGCRSGQIVDEDGYIFTCVECGHKMCILHNVEWHEGETCDEYSYRVSGAKERERKAQEEASIRAINQLSKKCPGPNCAFNIQKNDGCDHMTCSRCRHEFCWVCLADYHQIRKEGNGAHRKDCMYHSSRII